MPRPARRHPHVARLCCHVAGDNGLAVPPGEGVTPGGSPGVTGLSPRTCSEGSGTGKVARPSAHVAASQVCHRRRGVVVGPPSATASGMGGTPRGNIRRPCFLGPAPRRRGSNSGMNSGSKSGTSECQGDAMTGENHPFADADLRRRTDRRASVTGRDLWWVTGWNRRSVHCRTRRGGFDVSRGYRSLLKNAGSHTDEGREWKRHG